MNFRVVPVESDQALATILSQVAASDRIAFKLLYNQTHARLYGIVLRILSRGDLAGDCLQEAYVSIWRNAASFDPRKGAPMAWMATIARNEALDQVRRVKRLALEPFGDNFEPAAEDFDPLGSRDRSERLRVLMRGLSKLDAQKREFIMLAYYRGASRKALSKRFGIPAPTIKTQLRRALAHLKDSLPDASLLEP